jgi:hypothetical protein
MHALSFEDFFNDITDSLICNGCFTRRNNWSKRQLLRNLCNRRATLASWESRQGLEALPILAYVLEVKHQGVASTLGSKDSSFVAKARSVAGTFRDIDTRVFST